MTAQFCELLAWEFVPYVVGFSVTILGGHFVAGQAVISIWRLSGATRPKDQTRISAVLGLLERWLFLAALQLGYANFIALWLGIKTAGSWTHWRDQVPRNGKLGFRRDVSGRQVFNIFLTGTAINLTFVVLGDRLIYWLRVCAWEWQQAALAVFAAVALSLALLHFVRPVPRARRESGPRSRR